jgi:hypothetical protein
MLKTYETSKIVFNHSLKNDINMRIFEAMGSGALLFTNEIFSNGLEDLFVAGEDLVIYRDKSDLVLKVREYLDNPSRLDEIAKSGMGKVRAFHTYDNRVQEMFRISDRVFPQKAEDRYALSGALLSMGFIADSIYNFFSATNIEATGVKNRFILAVFRPYIYLLVVGLRLVQKTLKVARRHL